MIELRRASAATDFGQDAVPVTFRFGVNVLLTLRNETDGTIRRQLEFPMGQILQFRLPVQPLTMPEPLDIDLLTAVDVALRDLAEVTQYITLPSAREQAEACRLMLQDAYDAATATG